MLEDLTELSGEEREMILSTLDNKYLEAAAERVRAALQPGDLEVISREDLKSVIVRMIGPDATNEFGDELIRYLEDGVLHVTT